MHLGRTTLSKFLIQQSDRHRGRQRSWGAAGRCRRRRQGDLGDDRQRGARRRARQGRRRATCRARPSKSSTCWPTTMMLRSCEWGGLVAGMASEELEEPYAMPGEFARGRYLAGVRSARRLVEHRRQRLGRHDLLGAAPRQGGAADRGATTCSPAAGRWPPATRSTARPRCW